MIFLKVYAQGKFLPQEKWGFKAITTKSEENRLGLKFDLSLKFLVGLKRSVVLVTYNSEV